MSVFGHLIARLVFQVDFIMILHHWIEFTLLKVKHTPWLPVHTYVIWILNEFYDFLFWYSSSWILYAMTNTFWALPFLYAVFGCALQIRCLPQNHFHYLLTNFEFTSLWGFLFLPHIKGVWEINNSSFINFFLLLWDSQWVGAMATTVPITHRRTDRVNRPPLPLQFSLNERAK